MSRQSKRSVITVEYQRSNLESDRGSPVHRESAYRQSVLFHVDSAPNVATISAPESPKLGSLRSERHALTASLESLNSGAAVCSHVSGTSGPAQAISFIEGDSLDACQSTLPYDQRPPSSVTTTTTTDTTTRLSASPEKTMDRSSGTELFFSESSMSVSLDFGTTTSATYQAFATDKKSDSMSDSTSEKDRTRTPSSSRHARERSFERSLDNILDKCSEKSLDLNLSVDSWNGTVSEGGSRSLEHMASSSGKNSKADKKKKASWYSMLSPTYKSRSEDFRKNFKDIPKDERLIVDYSCALQKDILIQGRMYISQNWLCFYANIFRWETQLTISCRDITAITKEKTARVIPNAIQITTATEKYFFTSFGTRDKTYMMLFRVWQNCLMDQPMAPRELWQWIHYNYGEELGLTSSDDDYLPPPHLDDSMDRIKPDDDASQQKDLSDSSDHPAVNDSLAVPSNEDTDALVSDEVFNQSPSALTAPPLLASTSPLTDYGDTTEDSDSEVACSGHDHLEKLYLDEVFNLNVDKMFENIFTDSPFFRMFVGSRRTFDLILPSWEDEPDEEGHRVRNISYTLTLNNSIGPRTSPSTEKQVCYKDSKPGKMYCVDCEICNGGIPYGDSFYNVLRYCLTRVSLSKCRLRVTSELKFRKSVIGMFKNMIEKSAVNGLTDYFRNLSANLRREAERQESHLPSHQHQLSKKKLRRRRKPHASVSETVVQTRSHMDRQTSSTPPSPIRGVSLREEGLIKLNADMLVRVIIIILIFLVLCNAVLFYKLWAIEASTSGLYAMYTDDDINNLVQHPRRQEEWAQLLRQQRSLHQDEMSKWTEILATSVQLLEQMKQSLVTLQSSLQLRSDIFAAEPERRI